MVVKGRPRSRPPLGCERLGTRLRRTRRRRHLTRSPTVGSGRHHPSAGERDLSTAELAGDNGVERLHRQRLKRDDASQTKQAFRKVTDGVLLLSCTRTDCGTKDRPGERRMTAYERPLEECDGLVLPYRVHELPRVDLSWVVEDVGSPPQSAEGVAHPARRLLPSVALAFRRDRHPGKRHRTTSGRTTHARKDHMPGWLASCGEICISSSRSGAATWSNCRREASSEPSWVSASSIRLRTIDCNRRISLRSTRSPPIGAKMALSSQSDDRSMSSARGSLAISSARARAVESGRDG